MHFENEWLSRYPHPLRCIHDPGTEFTGIHFQSMLTMNGIQSVPTTAKNPQANAICERLHLTIGNMLRTMLHENPPQNVQTGIELVDTALASASYAVRTAVHRTMKVSPGALIYHRDMMLPIPIIANFQRLTKNCINNKNDTKEHAR